jgi:hypothetical protein
MVFGSVWEGQSKDNEGKPLVIKSGPNAGQPATRWSFGVAFPKVLANGQPNVEFAKFRDTILEAGRAGYPQYFNGPIDPATGKPGLSPGVTFATKIKDGDGFDSKGKPNNQKEGWAGHWVVVFSSSYAPRVFDINVGLDPTQQLQDKSRVLPGDYIAVSGTVEDNNPSQTPGVYVNGDMVCFIGGGPRIVSGPKASEAFAGVMAGQLPPGCVPGANPANVGAPTPPAPGAPTPPAAAPTPPAPPAPPAAPVGPQLTPAAIAAGFTTYAAAIAAGWTDATLTAQGYLSAAPTPPAASVAPAPPTPPAPPAAPVGPQLTPAGAALGTYETFRANGWTDDMLRQHGYLA